ncbi:PREDICTED: probable GPI-anchored adhesin-like protein PGA55 [Nicrophorus vespilloides]|uniref:Probable GPI-anchored adhesin-like protein PGA55 n=1 Tax=Nicrophorus vespilloides TaxID=110193 RepID=A0ABM1NB97_NICVS|nr:PREDICTED: probable GPI-anchored adhesin-like protein PGA55 [Nicrophorus vespilloides]
MYVDAKDCVKTNFTCGSDEYKVKLKSGSEMPCGNGTVCNKDYESPCMPCVPCKKSIKYECVPDDKNKIKLVDLGFKVDCSDGKICNADIDYCRPCIDDSTTTEFWTTTQASTIKECDKNVFQCFDDDPRKVKINGFDVKCDDQMQCNKEYLEPCKPCISMETTTELSTTELTTTILTTELSTTEVTSEASTTSLSKETTIQLSTTEVIVPSTTEVTSEVSTASVTTDSSTSETTIQLSTTEVTVPSTSETTSDISTTVSSTTEITTKITVPSTTLLTTDLSTTETSTEATVPSTVVTTDSSTTENMISSTTKDLVSSPTEVTSVSSTTEVTTDSSTTEDIVSSTTKDTSDSSTTEVTTDSLTTVVITDSSTTEHIISSTTEGVVMSSIVASTDSSTTEVISDTSTTEDVVKSTTEDVVSSTTAVTTDSSTAEDVESSTTEVTSDTSTTENIISSTTEVTSELSTTEVTTDTTTTEDVISSTTAVTTDSSTTEDIISSTTEVTSDLSTTDVTTDSAITEDMVSSSTEDFISSTTVITTDSSTTENIISSTTEDVASSTIVVTTDASTTEYIISSTTEDVLSSSTKVTSDISTTEDLVSSTTVVTTYSSTTEDVPPSTTAVTTDSSTPEDVVSSTTEVTSDTSTTENIISSTTEVTIDSSTTEDIISSTTEDLSTTEVTTDSSTTEDIVSSTTDDIDSSTTEVTTDLSTIELSTEQSSTQFITNISTEFTTEMLITSTVKSCDENVFICFDDDLKKVGILGFDMYCSDNEICNKNYQDPCKPCISSVDFSTTELFTSTTMETTTMINQCKKIFTCPDDPVKVKIGQFEFSCKPNEICNKNYVEPCDPCILNNDSTSTELSTTTDVSTTEKQCNKEKYTCVLNDPTTVKVGEFEFSCSSSKICNYNYEEPCDACIDYVSTTTETVTTSCPKNYECVVGEPRKIKVGSFELSCEAGKICNSDYQEPCQPCIISNEITTISTPDVCTLEFECFPDDPTKIKVGEFEFSCLDEKICNNDTTVICESCILSTTTITTVTTPMGCIKQFECVSGDPTKIKIGEFELSCFEGKICNDGISESCEPCIISTTTSIPSSTTTPSSCIKKFECVPGDPTKIKIGDAELSCSEGEICNDGISESCEPCIISNGTTTFIPSSTTTPSGCIKKFECVPGDPTKIIIGDAELSCSEGEICNNGISESCEPCIISNETTTLKPTFTTPSGCMKKFECVPEDPTKVIIGDVELSCSDGEICNMDTSKICETCIKDDSTSILTTPMTTEIMTTADVCREQFKCLSNDLSTVLIGNDLVECEIGQVCNINYEFPCEPCIESDDNIPSSCSKDKFQCIDNEPGQVIVNGGLIECGANTICNKNYVDPCSPCIKSDENLMNLSCSVDKFECVDNDPGKVIVNGGIIECGTNTICNKNYVDPCSPCIESDENIPSSCSKDKFECVDNDPGKVIVNGGIIECGTNTICNKHYVDPCSPCVTNYEMSLDVPNNSIINCNDGNSEQCRKNLKDPDYYYVCVRYLLFYKTDIRRCSDILEDPICKTTDVCRK